MRNCFALLLMFILLATPSYAEEQDLTTEPLEAVIIDSIVNDDVVAFAQCWVSAIETVEMMQSMAEIEPRPAEQVPSLKEAIEYNKERNKRIVKLYEGIQAALKEQGLKLDQLKVAFGEMRKREMGKLVRYDVPQIFELQSKDGWVIKIEIDDIMSFGGAFRFFDSPLHAELTLEDGETVEVYSSEEKGIQWLDEKDGE